MTIIDNLGQIRVMQVMPKRQLQYLLHSIAWKFQWIARRDDETKDYAWILDTTPEIVWQSSTRYPDHIVSGTTYRSYEYSLVELLCRYGCQQPGLYVENVSSNAILEVFSDQGRSFEDTYIILHALLDTN